MPVPKVSICLPNLNNRPFLEERLASIFSQTLSDWELIVVDNFSDDGAWELLQYHATKESRMRISQAPRAGMYANWNNCLRQVRGEYVYIATSDDTMVPSCLATLSAGLDRYPTCQIAACALDIIGLDGRKESAPFRWEDQPSVRFMDDWITRSHIRPAPHDGLLAFALQCPYTSMTQVLIRRQALTRIGEFSTEFGPFADLEWQMRAGLMGDCLYVPEHLATWRVYAGQGSALGYDIAWQDGTFVRMGASALSHVRLYDEERFIDLDVGLLGSFYRERTLSARLALCDSRVEKIQIGGRGLFDYPVAAIKHLWRTLCRRHGEYEAQTLAELKREIQRLEASPRNL